MLKKTQNETRKNSLEKGKKLNQRTNSNVNEVALIANNSFSHKA